MATAAPKWSPLIKSRLWRVASSVHFSESVPVNIQDLCFDPQTSGGLLFSVPEDDTAAMLREFTAAGLTTAACIGRVNGKGRGDIIVN